MRGKRFWPAFVAVYAIYQVLGFLGHQAWLDPAYKSLKWVFRLEEEMLPPNSIFFVTSLSMTFFLCFMLARGYGIRGIGGVVRYGLYPGLFFMTVRALDSYAVYPLPCPWYSAGCLRAGRHSS